jgi:hypothetical protein
MERKQTTLRSGLAAAARHATIPGASAATADPGTKGVAMIGTAASATGEPHITVAWRVTAAGGFVMSHVARVLALVAAAAALVFAAATPSAQAIITEPLPAEIPFAPPPIPAFPAAGETPPPADVIADPIEPAAGCGEWYLQSSYGGRWPTGSVWWEFACWSYDSHCTGYCNMDTSPDVFVDYFYWDGTQPAFYGEFYGAYYWASVSFGDPSWSASTGGMNLRTGGISCGQPVSPRRTSCPGRDSPISAQD